MEMNAVQRPEDASAVHFRRSAMAELRTPVCNFLQQILQADGLDVCVKVGFVTVDDKVLFYDRGVHLFNSL